MGIRKWLLNIIVDDRPTLPRASIVYDARRYTTKIVCDRKRLYTSVHDTEKYERNTGPCIPEKYAQDTFPFLNMYNRIRSCTNFATLDLGSSDSDHRGKKYKKKNPYHLR